MKKLTLAVVALAVLLLPSCATDMIHVDAIDDLIEIVSDRHDVYVEADESLSDDERRRYLRSTEILRGVIEEASK